MFHQPASQQPPFFSPARVLTPADYGWGEVAVESGHLTRRRLDSYRRLLRENAYAASRTDARLRAEQERPTKDIARMRRAINRSGNRQA